MKLSRAILLFVLIGVRGHSQERTLTFIWDPSPDPVSGYRLYAATNSFRAGESLSNALVKVDCGNVTNCCISNVTIATRWYFVCTARDTNNLESLPSNEVSVLIPRPPGGFGTVWLQWGEVLATTNWADTGFFRVRIAK
jgi:hypothetical protein